MIKDILIKELSGLPIEGLDIHILKKYEVISSPLEKFKVENLSVMLIRSGSFKIKLEDIIQNLEPRDLFLIPKDSYCTILEVNSKLQLYIITFSTAFTVRASLKKELVDSFYFLIRKKPLKAALEEKEYQVLSLIYKLVHYVNLEANTAGSDIELQQISLNLFLYELKLIYARYVSDSLVNFNRKESIVIQFLTILSIHYKKQHHVKFYAGALYVTPAYLNKTVKEITGKNVKLLIIEALISEAKILLEDNHYTIAEIAQELEFSSVSIFGIFFKKHTSLSLSKYRANSIERFKRR